MDALLCADGPVRAPVDLTLVAEHRRGHGAMYEALNHGSMDVPRLRQVLAGLPMPRAADGRLVLAVDVSNWLRPDAPTSAERLFCHVYGRSGRSSDRFVPGWPYSFVAALESGRTSWCQMLDAVRLGPEDDVAEVTAAQLRRVVTDLIEMGRWHSGDRDILWGSVRTVRRTHRCRYRERKTWGQHGQPPSLPELELRSGVHALDAHGQLVPEAPHLNCPSRSAPREWAAPQGQDVGPAAGRAPRPR